MWKRLAEVQSGMPVIKRTITLDTSKLNAGAHFIDDAIIVKSDTKMIVFSNQCTHAGCRIASQNNGELQCPCHGSKFDLQSGKVLKGPAAKPLKQLAYVLGKNAGEIIINL